MEIVCVVAYKRFVLRNLKLASKKNNNLPSTLFVSRNQEMYYWWKSIMSTDPFSYRQSRWSQLPRNGTPRNLKKCKS